MSTLEQKQLETGTIRPRGPSTGDVRLAYDPRFGSSPFYDPNRAQGLTGFDPERLGAASNVLGLLTHGTLQALGLNPDDYSFGTSPGLYQSPYAGRAGQLSQALGGLTGEPSFGSSPRSESVTKSQILGLGNPLQSSLMRDESSRQMQLIQLLLQAYGLGGNIEAQGLSNMGRFQEFLTSEEKAKNAQWGRTPIVGPILGAMNL